MSESSDNYSLSKKHLNYHKKKLQRDTYPFKGTVKLLLDDIYDAPSVKFMDRLNSYMTLDPVMFTIFYTFYLIGRENEYLFMEILLNARDDKSTFKLEKYRKEHRYEITKLLNRSVNALHVEKLGLTETQVLVTCISQHAKFIIEKIEERV